MSGPFGKIHNKQCCCGDVCCPGRCNPPVPYNEELFPGDCTGAPGENPLPSILTVEVTTDDTEYGCITASCDIILVSNGRWGSGRLYATCDYCCPTDSTQTCTWVFCADVFVQCSESGGWLIEFEGCGLGGTTNMQIPPDTLLTKVSCDPILLTGSVCFDPLMTCVVGPIEPPPPPPPITHPVICLSITVSETL